MYCDVNLKVLPCKNTQKVNKQKIRRKNSEFMLVVRMSWTRYMPLKKESALRTNLRSCKKGTMDQSKQYENWQQKFHIQ